MEEKHKKGETLKSFKDFRYINMFLLLIGARFIQYTL